MDRFRSKMEELQRYEEVISELDAQTEEVENSIRRIQKDGKGKCRRAPDNFTSQPTVNLERSSKKVRILSKQRDLARSHVAKRSAFNDAFKDLTNTKKLFSDIPAPIFDDFTTPDCKFATKSYHLPMHKSMALISQLMVTSCLVELNLRMNLQDPSLKVYPPASFLYRQKLFESMKEDAEKTEIMRVIDASAIDGGESKPFSPNLALTDSLSNADSFMSKQQRRLDIYLHKSARYHNYQTSDNSKSILAIQSSMFRSNVVCDDEYLSKLHHAVSFFKESQHSFKHIDFVFRITKLLSSGGDYTPSISLLRSLMDVFGEVGLFNYQSLVYDSLPSYDELRMTLADGKTAHSFAERDESHFSSLIESDSKFLDSLIKYFSHREDHASLKKVLMFLVPLQVSEACSNSPLFKNNSFQQRNLGSLCSASPITVDIDVVETALSACIGMRDYKLMDQLLNKFIFNSIDTSDGVKIALNKISSPGDLLVRKSGEASAVSQVFSANILSLLAQAFLAEKDFTRCEWLQGLLQKRVEAGDHLSQTLLDDVTLMVSASRAERSASQSFDAKTQTSTLRELASIDDSLQQSQAYQRSSLASA